MQNILTISFLLITISTFAQFQDNFSDGNLDQNPTWLGDTANFIINSNSELQLDASTSGTSQIYVNAPTADSTVWEFYVNLDFAPSTSNQLKVYLSSNTSDFSASLNGYYILVGESGSDDAIELRRQDGSTSTTLIRGTDGFVSAEPVLIRVRVIRDENYNWSLLVDYTGGNNFALEGSAVDNTYTFGQFFGISCKYTSTRVDKFFFDDFYIFPLYQDTDAPQINQIEVASEQELTVTFNENLDVITATDILNYSVNNGIGNPNQAVLDANDNKIVHLTFVNNFQDGTTNELTVSGVEDEAGNAINTATVSFQYVEVQIAELHDIIINEILADPTPSLSLPEVEFIEIYNRSDKNFDLENYTFSDASNDILLPNIVLQSNEYAIICDEDDAALFTQFGKVIGVESFPSLTNSGESLQLKNANNELIAQATSTWLLVNVKTRRLSIVPDFLKEMVQEINIEKERLPIAKGKIPKIKEADFQSKVAVKWFCLDTNNHVNHIHYFRWILEELPTIVHQTQSVKSMDIIMKSEATLGESLTVQTIDNQDDTYTHQVLNEDGKVVIQAISVFGTE